MGGAAFAVAAVAIFRAPFAQGSWGGWEIPLLAKIAAITLLEVLVVIPSQYKFYRYAILKGCIIILKGRFLGKQIIFPSHQVLYVETRRGLILRHYDLYKVDIGTIAEPLSIGPLSRARQVLQSQIGGLKVEQNPLMRLMGYGKLSVASC